MVTDSFMIGLLWFVMVRMLRFLEIPSGGQVVTWLTHPHRLYNINIVGQNYNNNTGEVKNVGVGGDMSDVAHSTANKQHENGLVEADYNSNCPVPANASTGEIVKGGGQQTAVETSHMSTTSSNDEESLTTNDVSDYQWFPDYVYGDNATSMPQSQHRPSIFSMVNYSSNIHDYEAISRNIDANLAEIDMEDFRSEDINSILAIPAIYCGSGAASGDFHSSGSHGEQVASLSASMMAHFDDDYAGSNAISVDYNRHQNDQFSISINSGSTDMSVCKSEQLFSPIKEVEPQVGNDRRHVSNHNNAEGEGASAAPHFTTFSVDSLDCDSYDEQELILTCQTNVDNYTIAFEGSLSRDSEDSDYHDEAVVCETSDTESWSNSKQMLPNFKLRNSESVDGSLVQSDFVYTTWTKLRHMPPKGGNQNHLHQQKSRQHQSRCPNSSANATATCNKSRSLPNLSRKSNLNSSFKISQLNISTTDSCILDQSQRCIPLYDIASSATSPNSSLQSLSLMRLFMQNRATSSSSCASSTGLFNSVTHSLSSGTLQQQTDLLSSQTDSNILDDRLQSFLNIKLANNNGDGYSQQDSMSPSGHSAFKRRAVSPLSSPIEEVDESDNTTTTTSNKATVNTLKNKISDDSIEENSANELELDCAKTAAYEQTQGTQTSGNNISGNNNSSPQAMIYVTNNNVQRGDSGVSLSSACASYGEPKRLTPSHQHKNRNLSSADKINSVTITMFATRGTQLPVHVCDEAIQTSFKGEWLEHILAKCSPTSTDHITEGEVNENNDAEADGSQKENQKSDSTQKSSSTIYVCYPNYSLPDLGFLKNINNDESGAKVKLSPKQAANKSSARPKSCPGLDTLNPNLTADLARIRDWDSLNVLLPQKVKELLKGWRAMDITGQPPSPPFPFMNKNRVGNNSDHELLKSNRTKMNLIPKGILRRSSTESISEIRKFVVPKLQTLTKLCKREKYSKSNADVEKEANVDKRSNCKCPVSGELTTMLGISLEQCDCENLSDSTFSQLCGLENNEVDFQDDAKGKKAVSFSSRQGGCANCEPRNDNVNRYPVKTSESNAKEDWSPIIEASEDTPPLLFFVSPVKDECDIPCEDQTPRVSVPSYGFTTNNQQIGCTSWERKQELVNAVDAAVKALNSHFSQARDPHTKFLMGSGLHTPTTGYKVLHFLCPTLFDILNDGLQPSVYNIFGHMENSVWMVVETLTQSGNCTKQMSDLVIHVNNEQRIVEKRMKFNAFAFGLLNIRSLASWFSLLGSSQNLIHKHYSTSAFLHVATTSMKFLFDELLLSLQTLSLLPFDLDLSLELQLSDHQQLLDQNLNATNYPQHRICLSSSPLKLKLQRRPCNASEDKPKSKHSKSSKLVHRHSCGHLVDELITQSQNDGNCDKADSKSHRLRRGFSQDSAIGTVKNSSDINSIPINTSRSNEEHREGWALKDLPKRPWSYAQDVDLDFENESQNSSKETCSNSSTTCTGDSSSVSSSSKEMKQIVLACRRLSSPHDVHTSENDQKLVVDTEKGSLDANIAERRRILDESTPKMMLNDKENVEDVDGVQFKELQMRWEILSGAPTSTTGDKKRVPNQNSRSKIPRLVMQLPTSPLPRQRRQLSEEQSPAVVSSTTPPAPTTTNRSSSGSNCANRVVSPPQVVAKTHHNSSPEKSPVRKKPMATASRVTPTSAVTTAASKSKRGTVKGASAGVTDETPN